MTTRRHFLANVLAGSLLVAAGHTLAAPPTVEILAMTHPPVKMALADLRTWLAAQGTKITVIDTDVESPQGEKRLAAVGLSGHIPVIILIDGQYRVQRKNGSQVDFLNFPNIPGAPPGVRGTWTMADVQSVLSERMK
jgi:hypothetical protein